MRVILPLLATLVLATACSDSVAGSGSPEGSGGSTDSSSDSGDGGQVDLSAVQEKEFADRNHVDGKVDYDESPPFGGPHNAEWADCTGTVYDDPIPDENAVHSLEHGAVWITHRPGVDVSSLADLVDGHDYTFMSPFEQDMAVSVQSWGRQLQTDDVDDPRIAAFIAKYRQNPDTTPEPGATCRNPDFPGAG